MARHIVIEAIEPQVDCGRYPVKAVVGRPVIVEADVFRDGHELIRVAVSWKRTGDTAFTTAPMEPMGNDRWRGVFTPTENTRYQYTVEAWTARFGSWLVELRKKVQAELPVASEALEGVALIVEASRRANGDARSALERFAHRLREMRRSGGEALAIASDAELAGLMERWSPRHDRVAYAPALSLVVDRERALFGAWYEMFPRSQGSTPGRGATLREAERRLPDVRDMGFDVVYLPPVHPIGETHRKGKNNALRAAPGDPGSPWAIGSAAGGHTAIDPALGTLDDFDHFVAAAREHGLEVAIDFAIQASPDHPWLREHPEWFAHRPDGTIKYAENPPKKYQDVHHLDFDTADQDGLWRALRDVVLFWARHGVRIFRVDNPHTKPVPFWHWLIEEVQAEDPGVIFLSEAFTMPKMMRTLAKAGFTQSYTYFTWRNSAWDLREYMNELVHSGMQHYFRPNFFVNTPDILPRILQHGGRAAFQSRLVLAATLSPTYGIYSGFELCENAAVPGTEEYLDSEKYEIKVRDWDAPGNIKDLVRKVNDIRRKNPALRELVNLRFLPSDNESLLVYAKRSGRNLVLVVVNLDPHNLREGMVTVPWDVVGRSSYAVTDLLTGERFRWGERNFVRLDPRERVPAHVLLVET